MKKTLFLSLLLSTLLPLSSSLVRADDYTGWQDNGYDWELVFSDDFNGDSLNSHNWTQVPYVSWNVSDWRKYQSTDPSLVEITEEGTVKLWAKYGEYSTQQNQTVTQQHACASIWSDTTFRFHYGYMEVKARYDSATGVWPAIWLMSAKSGTWPSTGEIDLMEHLNWQNQFYSTIHYWDSNGNATSMSETTEISQSGSEWHTYGVEWVENCITIFLDGTAIATFNNNSSLWPFNDEDNKFYIILSNQIGGDWVMDPSTGGNGNIGPVVAEKGVAMEIDYVHVYSSSDYNHLLVEGIWNTEGGATSSGGTVTLSGSGVYRTLDYVEQVHVNGNAAFDLTGETLEDDASDPSIGLIVNNLTGEAGYTLSIAGSGMEADLVTFSNNAGSTVGNETVSLEQVTANVKAEADEEGNYYTLGMGGMTLEQAALKVEATATLTVGNMELEGSAVTVEEGGSLSLGTLEGDAGSSLSGAIYLAGNAEYLGSYAEGTEINMAGNTGKVTLVTGSGLTLTNASRSKAGIAQEGGHAVIVYGEDKSINHIALSGTTVTLDNVGRDGSLSTLQLLNNSSMTNGMLVFSAYAHEMVASTATAITAGAALDLTGTQVVVNLLGDQGSTALAMEANGQTRGITLLEVAEVLERDENTTIAFAGSLASMLYRYYANIHWEGGSIVADRVMDFYGGKLAGAHNVQAGASLLDDQLLHGSSQPSPDVAAAMAALDSYLAAGQGEAASNLAAAVAGASIATLGSAFSGDVERQLRAIRNRTTTMGVDPGQLDEEMPCFNAWVNAEGDYRKMDEDGTAAGYTLSSWGGAVGFDVDISPSFTAGLAVTAMYGDLDSKGPDKAEGDFDTYYVSLFARYASRSWTHTFVGTVGWLDASLDRTVSYAGGSYKTTGDTEGVGFGLMYEVGYVIPLNEDNTACLQPVFNVAWRHIGVDGYSESGSDAGLRADDQSMDVVTFGLGARLQSAVAENIYNRSALFEARALLKVDAGDRQSDLNVGLLHGANTANIESAEIGAVGVELGAGLTIPVGSEGGALFIDGSAELRDGYTNLNGTAGYRINF